MDKYARQAGDNTYDSDAEADDEFERSVFSSPIIAGHFNDDQSDHPSESEDERSVVDGGDTPTTQGWAERDGRSPTGKITQWSEDEVADYIAVLSPALKQYRQRFVEEGISGEALISLHHDELRELGVASVGHRLTILKTVYEQKVRAGIKIEEGDYVPLSAEGEKGDMNATQDDIARIIESIKLRDQRIIAAEAELRAMKSDLDRIMDENKKLREETLPIMRIMKDQRTPLPDPAGGTIPSPREADMSRLQQPETLGNQNKGSSLSRKFSTKKLFLKSDTTKQPSPTHPPQSHTPQLREVRDDGGAHLEASAAAMAASNHLTASMTSQTSPNSVHGQQLSPTSPAYSTTQGPASGGSYQPPGSAAANRSFPRDGNSSRQDHRAHGGHAADDTGTGFSTSSQWSQASTAVPPDQPSARLQQDRARRHAPTPSPREDEPPHSARDRDNPQVEIFKSFRVGIEDPCRTVLPVALKRYNITDDWRQYALYIVHGDQERCLGLDEKPLLLFKQLDKEGKKPMFMLRRHASPQEGWVGAAGGGVPHTAQENKQIPGGVL
ncbi:related to MAPKKK cascade kinase regulator Ste50 [Lecanosticta acicola]|uniref:Related to MAPKKK cascade kinase regulator Ste50 n=1 Tax=Lecanosticta acicola TaxID=111012 RepID=A0AAI8YXC5_9PEZI|nr:related to MAPKKK cascade kinase regulator Ste50 [Lecanosticta acicola]